MLLEELCRPEAFPYPVADVEARQTHISFVFLAGPFVYKVKKPVNFGWVDFDTLAKRQHFCQEEVRLNRRLAADVYLGVVPIAQTARGLQFEGSGPIVEWAVKMQRLPESATLHDALQRGAVSSEVVETLAQRIAGFHRSAAEIPQDAGFAAVVQDIERILQQAEPHQGQTVSPAVFERVRQLLRAELHRLQPLLDERARGGRIRDCHGDLHLDHIYHFPERAPPADLVMIDCIEFNERLRHIDPVADMAFAVMDFRYHGRRDLAQIFTDAYFRASGDDGGRDLLSLYTAYRSAVRATVEGLKLAESEVPAPERDAALESARAHWLLALGDVEKPAAKPCLLAVAGLPGTGKSSLSAALAKSAGFTLIRADLVRKELAQAASCADLYAREWTERTYAECRQQAAAIVFAGKRVLIDATFRQESQRRAFLELARRCGVPAMILLCQAEPEVIRQRLEQRRGDASDADWEVYQQFADSWEPPGGETQQAICSLQTNASAEQVLDAARASLQGQDIL